jgi:hypothetical protein
MAATNLDSVKTKLETLVALARLLEKVDHSPAPVAAEQYQNLIERLKGLLREDLPADAVRSLLVHFPATAELYENLHYEHAGLVFAPLDKAVAAELAAHQTLSRWRRPAK